MGIVAALAVIIGAILAAILWACGGHLIYSLDDPYISLSLGWHIGHAHYGINTGEPASPSSSILFPFLLACFAWASWQQWVPFIVNAAAAVGTGLAFGAALCRYGIVNRPSQIPRACMFVVAVCLAINTVGLVFTGLEHSLHALTSVFVLLALARVLEEDRVHPSLIAAIVLLPLWRFEGMAPAILALAALMIAGHRRPATIGILAVGLTVGAYMATLHLMGLPLLPSSVLSKSAVARDTVDRSLGATALLGSIVHNASRSLNREAVPLFVLLALVLAHPALRVLRRANEGPTTWNLWRELVFTAVVAGVLIAHLLFGGWGTLARYTAYAAAAGTVGAIVLWRGPIIKFMGQKSALLDGLVLVGLFDIGAIYLTATAVTPASALGIFEQQYQMHRFVVDYYRRRVAVNDLGWVSYRNPNYVLDLWGLGSETVRQAREGDRANPGWIGQLVEARRIGLAMLYAGDFIAKIPPNWHSIAVLRAPHYIVDSDTVTFYATTPAAVRDILASLKAFSDDAGPEAQITVLEGAETPTISAPSVVRRGDHP